MATIKVEGIAELVKQFPEFTHDLLTAANGASMESMGAALTSAQGSTLYKDTGRATASAGNPVHPPGNLRSKLTLFKVQTVKRGKQRVWVSLGVPQNAGAAYHVPLVMGHKNRNRSDAKDFLSEAYRKASSGAKEKIVAAMNGVIGRYSSR